ncbi:MAG: hypothetical protein APU95_05120 [Hadesarchaea archaeon YNP_N21]|nr:MAG: hypothetical protein APU95_05120 [Hadesarchaea archaeon YNP_N21]
MVAQKTLVGVAVIIVIVIAAGVYYWYTASVAPPKVYKAAILLPASIDSIGWPMLGYEAIQNIGKKYGIETAYSEWVDPAKAVGIAVDYIEAGYNIIITHGGQYVTACEEIAKNYPDVVVVAHTIEPLKYSNVWTIIRDDYLPYYAIGYMMGKASKTGKIGYVGGLEFPTAIGVVNLVYQGAQLANPNIKMYYVHTGDFDAPVPNRKAAETQIAEGVDVIVPWLGGTGILGTLEAAKAAPRMTYLIGACTDMYEIDTHFLTSIVMDVTGVYDHIVNQVMKGNKSGQVRLAEYCSLASTRGVLSSSDEAYAMDLNKKVISGETKIEVVTDHYLIK